MYDDSVFMKKLNDPNYILEDVELFTISGSGCQTAGEDGDGVITMDNSLVPYATSFIVEGVCDDTYGKGLHNDLLDIDKYPLVYEYVKEALG
jgi:hypothetical protein